jgi:hypothetical protein
VHIEFDESTQVEKHHFLPLSVRRLPFQFDAAKLADEYPDLRKQVLVFEGVFDKLMKASEHVDKLILDMKPQSK